MRRKIHWALREALKKLLSIRTNSPFLSGDAIARQTDLVVTNKKLNARSLPRAIRKSRSIFIEGDNLVEFLDKYTILLKNKVVISGNSDANFERPIASAEVLELLLCQNLAVPNTPKLKTLPIGIENLRLARSGFKRLHQPLDSFEIVNKVLVPPMSATNPVRLEVLETAKSNTEIFDVYSNLLPSKEYFDLVRKYKFIFVCEGNGFDTHRLWEVLYQNSFPVALKSDWIATLDWLELPILTIESLTDINHELLEKFAARYMNFDSVNHEQLWIPYWKNFLNARTKNESSQN